MVIGFISIRKWMSAVGDKWRYLREEMCLESPTGLPEMLLKKQGHILEKHQQDVTHFIIFFSQDSIETTFHKWSEERDHLMKIIFSPGFAAHSDNLLIPDKKFYFLNVQKSNWNIKQLAFCVAYLAYLIVRPQFLTWHHKRLIPPPEKAQSEKWSAYFSCCIWRKSLHKLLRLQVVFFFF